MDLTRVDPTLGFLPNAAGSYGAWATVGSAHSCATAAAYACVNDDPNDGDATYIQTQTDLAKSTFNTLDWASPPSPLNITNVRASVWCKDTQSPVGSVRTLVKNGTNEALGTVTACTGAYAEIFTDYANYPLGASRAWTAIDINNLEIGVSASLTGGNGNPFVSEVKLTVTHDEFEPGSKVHAAVSNGWPMILSSLKSLLETGHASTLTSPEQARGARERAIALAASNAA